MWPCATCVNHSSVQTTVKQSKTGPSWNLDGFLHCNGAYPECTASQSLKATKWGKGWFTFFLPAHNQSRVSVGPGMRIGIWLGPLGGVKAGGASHSPPSARAPAGGGCGADRGRRARCAGGNEQPDKLVAIGMPSAAQLGREDEEALSGPGWRSSGKPDKRCCSLRWRRPALRRSWRGRCVQERRRASRGWLAQHLPMWRDATLSRLKSPAGTGVWVAAQHAGRSLLEDARAAHDGTAAWACLLWFKTLAPYRPQLGCYLEVHPLQHMVQLNLTRASATKLS